jgi:class 3 adenylate cyclase
MLRTAGRSPATATGLSHDPTDHIMTSQPSSSSPRLDEVRRLKQEGLSMAQIIDRLNGDSKPPVVETNSSRPPMPLTLEDCEHPAYMINQNFELVWFNPAAKQSLFGGHLDLPQTSDLRNLFRLLPIGRGEWGSLLNFHVSIAKSRLSAENFARLCRGLDPVAYARLQSAYIESTEQPHQAVMQSTVRLPGADGQENYHTAFASFFREGILIALPPESGPADELLELLGRRDEMIRNLLRQRLPVLTQLAVLVTDLQSSVKICSELPPEEYFELINEIWRTLAPIFRRHRGTCGKHVGDGMVYYFFPQPDSDYLANSVACALEIRTEIQRLSKAWQLRKQWFNELYLNTGITEGQEWLGTFQSPISIEFVVLGDTINQAARISDFARHGSIWVTKSLIGKLPAEDRVRLTYGVRRRAPEGREVFVASSFSQVSTLVEQDGGRMEKLRDIAILPITEVVEIRPPIVPG